METIKNIHRGEILRAAVKRSGMSVETIVNRMGYTSRNTFYNHCKQELLALDIIEQYGKVIKHDFGEEIPEIAIPVLREAETNYLVTPQTIEEAIRQRDFYFKQYIKLLEEVRKLEEEQNQGGAKK